MGTIQRLLVEISLLTVESDDGTMIISPGTLEADGGMEEVGERIRFSLEHKPQADVRHSDIGDPTGDVILISYRVGVDQRQYITVGKVDPQIDPMVPLRWATEFNRMFAQS